MQPFNDSLVLALTKFQQASSLDSSDLCLLHFFSQILLRKENDAHIFLNLERRATSYLK